MKVTRRAFLKFLPLGAAVSITLWWFLRDRFPTSVNTVMRTSAYQSIASQEADSFPEAWAEHADHPTVDPNNYLLRIDGEVSNPLQLTVAELNALPSVTQTSTIKCVEGWSATVVWEGIPLSSLLSRAGAPSEFDHLTVESITGYSVRISQDETADPNIVIALKAGSAPLNDAHGYPARLVLPNRPGLDWVKQVSRITCTKSSTG